MNRKICLKCSRYVIYSYEPLPFCGCASRSKPFGGGLPKRMYYEVEFVECSESTKPPEYCPYELEHLVTDVIKVG